MLTRSASLNEHKTLEKGRWFVVQTRPNREFGATHQLECQGFEVFLPVIWKTVRHARQFRKVKSPFFPRYLFVRLDVARQRWRSVNGTFGVIGLIMEGDRPRPVPEGVVEVLRENADAGGLISVSRSLERGDVVRVLDGPFAGRMAELVEIDERGRVRVLLDILGGRVAVSLRSRSLSPGTGPIFASCGSI